MLAGSLPTRAAGARRNFPARGAAATAAAAAAPAPPAAPAAKPAGQAAKKVGVDTVRANELPMILTLILTLTQP
eukprot:scaffold100842_cov72-Phaeocystis_antarctica.AAC.6